MWLSDSGQMKTIRAEASIASNNQVIGDRLTPRTISDKQAAARAKAETHQTSDGRSSRMMAVSCNTESSTPTSSLADFTGRVHPEFGVAHELVRGRLRRRRVDDPPRLDAEGFDGTVMSALPLHHQAGQTRKLPVARQPRRTSGDVLERGSHGDFFRAIRSGHE